MSISFTQSMHSLHADQGRFSLWGISLATLLLLLWAVWFFVPSLTVYTTGALTGLTRNGTVVATFPAQESAHLLPGQAARIHPTGVATNQATSLPATVLEVATQARGDAVQVTLYPESDKDLKTLFPNGVTGQVTVETETISPAVLLMRTTGQLIETPPVSLSPQNGSRE